MRRWVVLILVGMAFGVGALAGTLGLLWATGRLSEPSRNIADVAPTLSLDDPTPTPVGFVATEIARLHANVELLATEIASLSDIAEEQKGQFASINAVLSAIEEAVNATPLPTSTPLPPTATFIPTPVISTTIIERGLFRISADDSEVRFIINEILAGIPNTVVGTTREVGGDIIVNFQNPSLSQIGQIAINARTFKTDTEFRDQSIRGQILQSSTDEYEFIIFEPTQLTSLMTEPVQPGDTVEFQVIGDLTIVDVTRTVTFDTTVTLISETQIEGLARTEVLYADFGLVINPPPTVAGVEDTVILELEFVANLAED